MSSSFRGQDTRNLILQTSLALFSKNGYDATSVAEICQSAGVSKGAFYHHFPSKHDLFLTLMTEWLDQVDSWFLEARTESDDIVQALVNMAGVTGQFYGELEGGFPILLEFWTQAIRQPLFWEQAVEPYRKYLGFFRGMIESGKEAGAFQEDLDLDVATRLLMGLAMGLMLQAAFDPQGSDWEAVTRSGISLMLKSMRKL